MARPTAWLVTYALILMPIACLLAPLEWRRGRPRADGRARTLPAVTGTVVGVAGCACLALAGFTSSVSAFTGTVRLTAAAALTRCRGTMRRRSARGCGADAHET